MKRCNQCNTKLLDDARFCHNCGAKVLQPSVACQHCDTLNPSTNKNCYSCGKSFSKKEKDNLHYQGKYYLEFKETASLAPQIKKYFSNAFQWRIEEEHQAKDFDQYLNRLEASDFKSRLDLRLDQLAEEAYGIHAKQDGHVQRKIDHLLTSNFNQLLDHFIILHCQDLNEHHLSEGILSYHNAKQGSFDLQKMILDFLELDREKEAFYTDFILMPVKKLKNASQAFLFPDKDEKIMLIADQTIFGSCKEGFALTEKGLYWKAHFEKAKRIFYHEIHSIKKEKDWLMVNGEFFNVSPSINLKMMKLLKKLSEIY